MFQKSWYMAGRGLIGLYVRNLLHADISQTFSMPAGPKIIAVNHPSTGDPAFVTTLLNEQASILILDAVFRIPVFGRSLRMAGHVPVIPGKGKEALAEAVRLLKSGRTVIIFPEGVISTPGGFNTFHSGVARLALATGVPVVPVGISLDSNRIRLMGHKIEQHDDPMAWYLHGPYAMTVGRAISFEGCETDFDRVQQVTEIIKRNIIGLSRAGKNRLAGAQLATQRQVKGRSNIISRTGSWAARSIGLRVIQMAMFLFMSFSKH